MSKPRLPSRPVLDRDFHRRWLTLHFLALAAGLAAAFAANRFWTPDRFWAHWVAIGWGALFAAHLAAFSRATLATMGGRRSGRERNP